MKLSNLLDRDFKIVEKRKIFFLVPIAIVIISLIVGVIYGIVFGSPFNVGIDFSGGYTINIELGTKLTDDTYNDYRAQIEKIVESLKDEEGKPYNIKVSNMQRQGTGGSAAIYVKYKAVADEDTMSEEVNPRLASALEDAILKTIPAVTVEENAIKFTYAEPMKALTEQINERLARTVAEVNAEHNLSLSAGDISFSSDYRVVTLTTATAGVTDELSDVFMNAMTFNDKHSGSVSQGDTVGASMSSELLTTSILVIILAIMLMMAYIAIRFKPLSGLAAIIALFHDIIIMVCFMLLLRIEITSTFIAALITILGYSINNTIIVFDRVRENGKLLAGKGFDGTHIANISVKETVWRSINTTITTLIMIAMVAIIGVPDIRIFAIPIIIGLLAGTYSSIFIAPSVWAAITDHGKKTSAGATPKGEDQDKMPEIKNEKADLAGDNI